jgi:hypothetical protein|tara:strand:+ start:140 stop:823 length:684 start_codon:yes stop_codon:yes gene_type:complete
MSVENELQAPFPMVDIEWRVQREVKNGAAAMVLAYVTNRAIQQRLDDVFGVFGWQNRFKPGASGGLICELSVRNPDNGEWVIKEDGASNTDIESVKGGMSSAMKRTAVQLGIGRYLYNLEATFVDLKQRGQNYHKSKTGGAKYWDPPNLPKWALPDAPRTAKAPKTTKVAVPSESVRFNGYIMAMRAAPDADALNAIAVDIKQQSLPDNLASELREVFVACRSELEA